MKNLKRIGIALTKIEQKNINGGGGNPPPPPGLCDEMLVQPPPGCTWKFDVLNCPYMVCVDDYDYFGNNNSQTS